MEQLQELVFVEYLRNLNVISVHLQVPLKDTSNDNLTELKVQHDRLWLVWSNGENDKENRKTGKVLLLSLSGIGAINPSIETPSIPTRTYLTDNNLRVIEAKIPVEPPAKPSMAVMEKPLNAQTLSNVSDIKCHSCSTSILSKVIAENNKEYRINKNGTGFFARVLEMPSDYWFEFVDCWVCHPDEQHVPAANASRLSCKPRVLMTGASNIKLHEIDLDFESGLSLDYGSQLLSLHCGKEPLAGVVCRNCGSQLGVQLTDTEFQLRKHLLDFHFGPLKVKNEENKVRNCSVLECILYELFENSRANANYKFILESTTAITESKDDDNPEEDGRDRILIWVLNWQSMMEARKSLSNKAELTRDGTSGSATLKPAVKLLYLHSNHSDFKQQYEKWSEDPRVDVIRVPGNKEIQQILAKLSANNNLLPKHMRKFPGDIQFQQSFHYHSNSTC